MNTLSLPRQSLSASQIEDIRLAASKMHGADRRAFQAEMSLKYCEGNVRLTETIFGWGRETRDGRFGGKKRTGLICYGAQSALSGNKRWRTTIRGGGRAAPVSGIACATRPDLSHGVELYPTDGGGSHPTITCPRIPRRSVAFRECDGGNFKSDGLPDCGKWSKAKPQKKFQRRTRSLTTFSRKINPPATPRG